MSFSFNFTVAMVTEMTDKNRLKVEKLPFRTKFQAFDAVDFLFIVTPIVGVCNVLCFVVCYFVSILALQSS